MFDYDVVVVGGGPGGYEAAIRCSQLGKKTAIIEKDKLGGTCLNVGCIPTKTLVHNAEIIRSLKTAKRIGIDAGAAEVNIKNTIKNKNKVVSQLVGGVGYLMQKNNIKVYQGEAVFVNDNEITVDGESLSFEYLIIAIGSSNNIPPIPGLDSEGIMTSTEVLDIDHIPETLTIIGGGVIGCEIACVFSAFGSKVTVIEMMDHIVPNMDSEVSDTLKQCMESDKIKVLTGTRVNEVVKTENGYMVKASAKAENIEVETTDLMVSIGRRGNCEGLEPLGLKMDRTYICIDEHMKTNKENIYAIGDITGKIQLAHAASAQGIAAAENIAGGASSVDYGCIPSCIFTNPEISSVGITEDEARKQGLDIVTGQFPMMACGRAKTVGAKDGFTKLVADKTTGRVLGGSIVGPNASELIGEITYIVRSGGTLEDVKKTVHAHPTINETIMEAAHVALGEPISI